jgi:hypothetical protein
MIRCLALLAVAVACGPGAPGGPTMHNKIGGDEPAATSPIVSADILARDVVANHVEIKHILISWKDTGEEATRDPRANKRTKHDAEDQVRALLDQLKAGADFDALMKQFSEDPGSANGRAYEVSPGATLVIEFKQLGMRLRVGEVGVVQSDYGFHIMKRVS